jgi:hypothetical protein
MTEKLRANAIVGFVATPEALTFSVKGAGDTTLTLARVHADVMRRAAIHGLKQRVSDAAAQSRDPKTGASASAHDKLAAMAAIVDHYNSGSSEWRLKGGDRIGTDEVLLARALAEVYPDRDVAKLRAYVGGLTKPERTKLLMTGAIKVAADRLRTADVETMEIDTDALLAKLDVEDDATN